MGVVMSELIRNQLYRPAVGDIGEEILHVDHADDVVEGLAIDREPRMTLFDEEPHCVVERGVELEADDVDPLHHDVAGGDLVKLQDVGEERALVRVDPQDYLPGQTTVKSFLLWFVVPTAVAIVIALVTIAVTASRMIQP